MPLTMDEVLRIVGDTHAPAEVTEEIRRMMPYYLWIDDHWAGDFQGWDGMYEDTGETRMLHCEACEREMTETRRRNMTPYKQGNRDICPMCGAGVIVKHLGIGYKNLRDRLDVVWWKKGTEPGTVAAIACQVERVPWSEGLRPWEAEIRVTPMEMAAFRYGEGGGRVAKKWVYEDTGKGCWKLTGWVWQGVMSMSHLRFGDESGFMAYTPDRVTLYDTLEDAVRGTPFERAWDEDYRQAGEYYDGVAGMDLIARELACEYLKKMGGAGVVRWILNKMLPARSVNLKGKSAAKVLKISADRWGQFKGLREIDPRVLMVIQLVDAHGWRCSMETARGVARKCGAVDRELKSLVVDALAYLPEGKKGKALKYIAGVDDYFRLLDIADYWRMLSEAENAMTDDGELFPRDFRTAHDRMARRIKQLKHRKSDGLIAAREKDLNRRYGFAFGGLILRAPVSAGEIVREGEIQHICVGSYVESCASGKTTVMLLRRAVQPDVPFRTVEIDNRGRVVQDRGVHNDWGEKWKMDDTTRAMLDLFWDAWRERKIEKETKSA